MSWSNNFFSAFFFQNHNQDYSPKPLHETINEYIVENVIQFILSSNDLLSRIFELCGFLTIEQFLKHGTSHLWYHMRPIDLGLFRSSYSHKVAFGQWISLSQHTQSWFLRLLTKFLFILVFVRAYVLSILSTSGNWWNVVSNVIL